MNDYEVVVKVPASTANLGSGFDSIGMALQRYTTVKMKLANQTKVNLIGQHQQGLPMNKQNLIYQAADYLCRQAEIETPQLEIEVESEIPLSRGLGSSGAAIIGGMVAVNTLVGTPFTKDEIFQLASELEGHPDNVGASLFGGVLVAAKNKENKFTYVNFPPPEQLKVVVSIPDYELQTKEARGVLPEQYSREDAVHALSHAALLSAALMRGDFKAMGEALNDQIHQPYRKHLIPGFEEILENGKNYGAIGAAISGAGPTIIAFTSQSSERLILYIKQVMEKYNVNAQTIEIPIDYNGVVCKINERTFEKLEN